MPLLGLYYLANCSSWFLLIICKQTYWDTLCVRYGWEPSKLPSHCTSGANFTTTHAFSCSRGAFPTIRHDQIHDLIAQLLTEVCPSVEVELPLQPLSGESFHHRSANVEDNTRLDVKALGLWVSNRQSVYLDVRCSTHTLTPTQTSQSKQLTEEIRRKKDTTMRRE